MSKNLLSPKSPFEEILTNLPLSIVPINLKFFNFFDRGVSTILMSISISLFIFLKISF